MDCKCSKILEKIKLIKSFKDFTKTDFVIIGLVCFLLLVTALAFVGKNRIFSKTPVEAEQQVAFQVFLRGITITNPESPLRAGEETFITIRNVPYTKLKIMSVIWDRKKIVLPGNTKEKFIVVDDLSLPFQFDFLVTLVDTAKITKDGAVVGGNKLKIGVPIVLEGIDYKINGTISNIQIIETKQTESNETTK